MSLLWDIYRDMCAGLVTLMALVALHSLWVYFRPLRPFKIRYKPERPRWMRAAGTPPKRRRKRR